MKLSSFHAIGSEVVRRRATPQPVFARYKLLEIERTPFALRATWRGQIVVPGLSRAIARRLSRVNAGGNARRRRIVFEPIAWTTARFRAVQASLYRSTVTIYTC